MRKAKQTVPVMDIYVSSFLALKGIDPNLVLQGTRVIFEFPATEAVYKITRDFSSNPSVQVLDYVKTIRQLRARMISMKENSIYYPPKR